MIDTNSKFIFLESVFDNHSRFMNQDSRNIKVDFYGRRRRLGFAVDFVFTSCRIYLYPIGGTMDFDFLKDVSFAKKIEKVELDIDFSSFSYSPAIVVYVERIQLDSQVRKVFE